MAETGLQVVESLLPGLKHEHQLDVVIAQAENVSSGRGTKLKDLERLRAAGVDFCTGGNWTLHEPEIYGHLSDAAQPIVRPANYSAGTPGLQYKYLQTNQGKILIVSLLGGIVGKDAEKPVDNPLKVIDKILEETADDGRIATVVNFHGDYSSEKVIIGYYLDGKASLVVGDHWHVPTADAMVLPHGTAHVSDVGMCGVLHASLGVSLESVIPRWHDDVKTRNVLSNDKPWQLNGVIVELGKNGLATAIEPIRQIIN